MDLKRKRSASDLDPDPDLPFSALSLSPSPSSSSSSLSLSSTSPSRHPGGRTLKRFRDSRPSPEDIHRNTLNMLYAAQRNAALFKPAPPTDDNIDDDNDDDIGCGNSTSSSTAAQDPSQTSLHRFFTRVAPPQHRTGMGVSGQGQELGQGQGRIEAQDEMVVC